MITVFYNNLKLQDVELFIFRFICGNSNFRFKRRRGGLLENFLPDFCQITKNLQIVLYDFPQTLQLVRWVYD